MILKISVFSVLATLCSALPAQWTPGGTQLTFSGQHHSIHKLAPTQSGGFYMTWNALDTTGKVMLNAFDQNGVLKNGWPSGGIQLSEPGGDYWESEIVTSQDGSAIVCWWGYTTLNTGADRRHVFVQKYDDSGTPQWNGGNAIQVSQDSFAHHNFAKIISDGDDGIYVAWVEMDLNLSPQSQDIYIQRVDKTGTIAGGWPGTPVPVASQSGKTEGKPTMALSGNKLYMGYTIGNTIVTLHLQRIDPSNGTTVGGWDPTEGLVVSTGTNIWTNAGRDIAVYTSASGEAVVLWVEFRNLGEIYIQRVTPAGTIQLQANGKVLIQSTGDDLTYYHSFMRDEKITFAWRISQGLIDNVYVNRTDLSGFLEWTPSFPSTSGVATYPKVLADGTGGSFRFNKEFGSPDQLHATRITSTGLLEPGWSQPGTSFGTIGNFNGFKPQQDFQILSPSPETAIAVWVRQGGDNLFDLFACNLLSDGSSCVDTVVTGIKPSQQQGVVIAPNPAGDVVRIDAEAGAQVFITDLFGRHVFAGKSPGRLEVDVRQFAPAVYLVRVETIKGTQVDRLAVSKQGTN